MLTCLVIKRVNVSALCRTNQHSSCHCHEEYAAFVLFLPSSHCSNCSPVFLRKSNVQLRENRQNPLIWNTKTGLRREKLGLLFTLIDVCFHAKNHPCGWDFPCDGSHTHRLLLATFSCVSQLLFCRWEVVVAGWEAPGAPRVRTVPSSLLLLHHRQTPLKTSWPRNNEHQEYKLSVCWGGGRRLRACGEGVSDGASKDLTLSYCPGARATQPLQHQVRGFGWSCGWRWAHINMPTSAMKLLRCKHIFASNCSGESGLLGALTF